MTSSASLELYDVHKSYGSTQVLRGAHLTVEPGTVTALLGDNGAGKSTLIKCCVGLERPDRGQIVVCGESAGKSAEARALVGVMLQDGGLPTTSCPQAFLAQLAGFYNNPLNPSDLIHTLGISDYQRRSHRRLSGGQRQRVSLAAALLGRPLLAFLDEPTAGMDSDARVLVKDAIQTHVAQGGSVVLTTHHLDEAAELADRVAVLHDGIIIAEGTAEQITARAGSKTTRITLPATLTNDESAHLLRQLPHECQATFRQSTGHTELLISHWLSTAELHGVMEVLLSNRVELLSVDYITPTLDEAFAALKASSSGNSIPETAGATR